MANAPGAGWSAIGAALTNGMGAFRDQAQATLQQKRENLTNALLQDQLNELPKKHAEDDLTRLLAVQGDAAYDNPQLQQFAKAAGVPFQTASPEKPPTAPGSGGMLAEQWDPVPGVAPHSGIVLPPDVAMRASDRQRKQVTDDLATKALQSAYGDGTQGQGLTGFDRDVNNVPTDTPRNRQLGAMLGANDPIVKIHGPAGNSPSNVTDKARAEAAVKAEIPPAMMQRITGGMGEVTDNLTTAQKELEKMFPGIENQVDANGQLIPNAQYNGALDLAKARVMRGLYNYEYTPYNKAIQSASLGNLQGWASTVPGRINPQIISKLQEHQSAFGTETPLATYQRNKELIDMTKRNKADLLSAGQPQLPPQSGQVPPPSGSAPPPQDAPGGAKVASKADIMAYATARKLNPAQAASALKAAGYTLSQ